MDIPIWVRSALFRSSACSLLTSDTDLCTAAIRTLRKIDITGRSGAWLSSSQPGRRCANHSPGEPMVDILGPTDERAHWPHMLINTI